MPMCNNLLFIENTQPCLHIISLIDSEYCMCFPYPLQHTKLRRKNKTRPLLVNYLLETNKTKVTSFMEQCHLLSQLL